MSDTIEQAQQGLEHAHEANEAHPQHNDHVARRVAILISVLAAALALADMSEKSAQNDYLTQHIAASDAWAFYQAKTIRADLHREAAAVLDSLPTAADPDVRKRAEAALATAARLDDDDKTLGRKQLSEQARQKERVRDDAFEHYHKYERVVGALQISIVLASVSVVTRMKLLALAAGAIGGLAALYGVAVGYAGL
jgi:hypothetical protein